MGFSSVSLNRIFFDDLRQGSSSVTSLQKQSFFLSQVSCVLWSHPGQSRVPRKAALLGHQKAKQNLWGWCHVS